MIKTNTQKATEFCRILELKNSGEEVPMSTIHYAAFKLLQEEVDETKAAIEQNNIPEILDGFADAAFVALNGIYKTLRHAGYHDVTATLYVDEIMQRVCDANLAKFQPDGTVKYNEHGKIQKPEGWRAPSYEDLLR